MRRVSVYASGPVSCSACAPVEMTREQVEADVNRENPTGISSRWRVSDDPTFAGGEPNPAPCERNPDRRHWLLTC